MENKRIVYIEDAPEMIRLVSLFLQRHGFDLIGASSGQEGLQLVRKIAPDLILLDLMMPDMNGWDVYQAIKADKKLQQIPVIVITVKARSIDRALGVHTYRVDEYITKPFDLYDLLQSIYKVLGQKKQNVMQA